MENNYFTKLNEINVSDKVEKKNGLSYLSWAWAWAEIKKIHPKAIYTIYENKDGWNYFTDGRTGWVKTGVTIDELEHIEYLPIMDYKNKSIQLEMITSFDVNKTIQRSLTKAVARHGLGLYIYAGEDLPEGEEKITTKEDAENYVLNFGKHAGKTLKEIVETDTKYINWLLYNDKTDETIKNAICLITGEKILTEEEQNEQLMLISQLNELMVDRGTDREKMYKYYKVKSNTEMNIEQLKDAIKKVSDK